MNWMMVLGSSGERLDNAISCLAGGGIPGFRVYALIQTVQYKSVNCTFQSRQRVEAALLVAGEEAVTVEEVGPGHFDGLKGVSTVLPQCLACAAARPDHLVILAGRGEHRAAYETYLRGALPVEQGMDDAQEEVFWSGLCFHAVPVAEDVGEHGSGRAALEQLLNMIPKRGCEELYAHFKST